MREELYAHLLALYEQQRKVLSDENHALSAAVEQFGDPRTIRDELQASVPRWERLACVRLHTDNAQWRRKPDESAFRYDLRTMAAATALAMGAYFVLVAIGHYTQGRRSPPARHDRLPRHRVVGHGRLPRPVHAQHRQARVAAAVGRGPLGVGPSPPA